MLMYYVGYSFFAFSTSQLMFCETLLQLSVSMPGLCGYSWLAILVIQASCRAECSLKRRVFEYARATLQAIGKSRLALRILQKNPKCPIIIQYCSAFIIAYLQFQLMLDFDSIFSKKKDPVEAQRTYKISNRQIRQEKLLAQGAFGYIWKAVDINSKEIFALKRVICSSKERFEHAKAEMETMKALKESPHLVKFYGGCIEKENDNPVVITLMQLCPNGTLFDQMASRQGKGFTQQQLLKIVESIALGIKAVHESGFAHRDIKIQNVLIGSDSNYKLCDFGSCTNQQVDFGEVPSSNYSDYEDEFQTNTTPMYRPPEMVDPFKKFKVGKQVDAWMLGCVLYTICYYVHPFIDASKAGISSAAFRISKEKCSQKIHDLIRNMLTPNPANRANVDQILTIVRNWSTYAQLPLNKQAKQLKEEYERKEKQLAVYDKKTVQYSDDIPIEVLMKLQNELKQKSEQPITTFRNQTQHQAKLLQKVSAPPANSKSTQNKPQDKGFNEFSFNNVSKPSTESWKGDEFFKQPVKKAQSVQFDFFSSAQPHLPSTNSSPPRAANLTSQAEFYEFFRSDSNSSKGQQQKQSPSLLDQIEFI